MPPYLLMPVCTFRSCCARLCCNPVAWAAARVPTIAYRLCRGGEAGRCLCIIAAACANRMPNRAQAVPWRRGLSVALRRPAWCRQTGGGEQ
eukprot:356103-Chlamydomonas_euryale.AAC.2